MTALLCGGATGAAASQLYESADALAREAIALRAATEAFLSRLRAA
jgi:hypothetical protein